MDLGQRNSDYEPGRYNKMNAKHNYSDFYQGKRVLVTGHTGFKGSWLTEWLLMMGAKVTGFALPPSLAADGG